MNTRRAADDSAFRQEKYMSSAALQRGLLANCVASRVRAIESSEDRKLIWFLQSLSHQPGGLEKAAREMLELWPDRFATDTLQRLGTKPGRIYSAEEVKAARESLRESPTFLLSGECEGFFGFPVDASSPDGLMVDDWQQEERRRAERVSLAKAHPNSYPAAAFVAVCAGAARRDFAEFLFKELCLNPAVALDRETLWYLPSLRETLRDYLAVCVATAATAAPVTTEIGSKVNEALDYALAERCLVVVDGLARTGKTFAVTQWASAHPGEARYVQVPSSNDDMSFFRAIGEALGIGLSHAYKAHELRDRIEQALHGRDLLLILDEGHYLWPQRNMRKAVPHRINWMLTQLVNMGVPVAVITTPQFTKSQETLVKHGGWSSEQLVGRIAHYESLPASLSEQDLEAVARHWLPEGADKAIRILVTYAQTSGKYLQGIESLVRRARFVASKAGRSAPTWHDVAEALKGSVVPSDRAMQAALSNAPRTRRQVKPSATPLQSPRTANSDAVQESVFLPRRETGGALLGA